VRIGLQRNKKNEKSLLKKKRSEAVTGYLLVAPALLLIFGIAIWPVMQSFYFSLFDLELNDPTKSDTNLEYRLDLDRYLQNYPFLIGSIDNEINNGIAVEELSDIKDDLVNLDTEIQSNREVAEKYQMINDKLNNFETITAKLSVVSINNETAEHFNDTTNTIIKELKSIRDRYELKQPDVVVGLANGLNQSIIKPNFIGLDHYVHNFQDVRMWKALSNTMIFTVISVAAELLLGLGIALLINKAFFGRGLIRASILIPWAIPTAVSALMWKFLYDGQNGIIAKIFEEIGLVENMANLLTTDTGAMFSVIFTDVWKTTPYMALLILAGLQIIPESLYEAASIDGANKWKRFLTITLPLLKSSILVALLFRTLDAFRVFDLIYVLTGGGPANSTETISILAYTVMFSQSKFGEGSALSVIVFICVAIISAIYIKFLGSELLKDGSAK
jgi:multiple sugar transport system permease protein